MRAPSPAGPNSDPVMRRLARGEESALAELLERHWSVVADYAGRLVGSADLAQDVAQEAFVRLWDRRTRWDHAGDARPILLRIARNLALDERRADRVRARWRETEPAAAAVPVTGAELVDEAELRDAVDQALGRLGAREREVVVLSRFHGLERAEVAAITGLTPGSVSNLLSIAMARLARALAPHLDAAAPPRPRRVLRRA